MYCNEKNHCHVNHCQSSCLPEHVTYNINNLHCCCCGDKGDNGISSSCVPIGTIIAYPAATIPSDYLKCNGAEIERAAYAALFEIIGETYGKGDGETTFNLPDLRGEFIRGLDDGRNVDNARMLGSAQGDAIRNITGNIEVGANVVIPSSPNLPLGVFDLASDDNACQGTVVGTGSGDTIVFNASRVVPTANENRPRNVAMIYCIKAK